MAFAGLFNSELRISIRVCINSPCPINRYYLMDFKCDWRWNLSCKTSMSYLFCFLPCNFYPSFELIIVVIVDILIKRLDIKLPFIIITALSQKVDCFSNLKYLLCQFLFNNIGNLIRKKLIFTYPNIVSFWVF